MDIPLIRKFALGYEEGARFASPKIEVLQNMTGHDARPPGPIRRAGAELARSQFDRGADIVFAAAGTTGIGVLQAAKDAGKLSIGCDFQPELPASRLGSDLDDQARRQCGLSPPSNRRATAAGSRAPRYSALAEDGIGYAVDDNNAALVTSEMTAKAEAAKADIIAGRIKVTDYMAKIGRRDGQDDGRQRPPPVALHAIGKSFGGGRRQPRRRSHGRARDDPRHRRRERRRQRRR